MDKPVSDGIPDQAVVVDKTADANLGWRAALSDDLKQHPLIKDYQKPSEAIRDLVAFKESEGRKLLIPDMEKATAAEKAAYYAKLGRPEKPEGYEFTKPEGLPDEMFDAKLAGTFAQFLYERGAPKSLAQDIYKFYNQMVMDGSKSLKDQEAQKEAAEKQVTEAAINKLKDEWKGDKFTENTSIAVEAFKKFANEDSSKFIETAKIDGIPLGNHPQFLKLFCEIGKLTKDDSALLRKEGGGSSDLDSDADKAARMYPEMISKAR